VRPACEELEPRYCPAAGLWVGPQFVDPFPGEPVPYTTLAADGVLTLGAASPGGPRVQTYDLATGVKLVDHFVGDPNSRVGVALVPVGTGVRTPVETAMGSIPQRVFNQLAANHWPGVATLHGVDVTSTPSQAPFAGTLTFDGRAYDHLPATSHPATVDVLRATPQEVRHEVAHDWLSLLGEPVPPTTPGSWATGYERGSPREYAAELAARVWAGLPVGPAERDWVISIGGVP
jgi:hypothetical protein